MEFILIYIYHLIFVYGVCRLDGKDFYIWPYAFYIFVYVVVFWIYLCFFRFLLNTIKIAVGKLKSSVIAVIRFIVSLIIKRDNKVEAPEAPEAPEAVEAAEASSEAEAKAVSKAALKVEVESQIKTILDEKPLDSTQ